MPTYRVTTDRGKVLVKSDKPLDPAAMGSVLTAPPAGVTVTPEAPTMGSLVSGLPAGGDEGASLGRMAGRALGGLAGGLGGAAIGGPAAPLTAIGGAGAGTALADAAMEAIWGEGFKPGQTIKQGAAGMAGEALSQGLAVPLKAGARALGLSRALTPAQEITQRTAKKFDVPLRASEITGGATTAKVEAAPSYFPLGAGAGQRFSERQAAAALRALRGAASLPELSPAQVQGELARIGEAIQTDVPRALAARQRLQSRLYQRIERLAGNEPAVDIGPVVSKALALQREAQVIGGPAAVTTLAKKGTAEASDELKAVLKSLGYAEGEVPDWAKQVMAGEPVDLRVPFSVARRLESELGELSRFGSQTSVTKSRLRALYAQTRRSIEEYLDSPAGATVKPELAEAKRLTRETHRLFDQGINAQLLKGTPENVVARVFRPGQVSELRAFREAVNPTTFEATKIAWLAGLVDQAVTQGRFQPVKFEKLIRPFLASGQMAEAFGPKVADQMRQLSGVMGKMGAAERLAANPSGTGQAIGGMDMLKSVGTVAMAPASALVGHSVAGLPGAVTALVAPPLAAQWVVSNPGIKFLLTGFSGKYSRWALSLAMQAAVQGYAE